MQKENRHLRTGKLIRRVDLLREVLVLNGRSPTGSRGVEKMADGASCFTLLLLLLLLLGAVRLLKRLSDFMRENGSSFSVSG